MTKIDSLLEGYIAPLLRKNGFKKKKRSWNRVRGKFIDVIEVQESKGSTVNAERFTLNIGVFVPEYFEAVWGEPYKGFAKESDCVVRFRLGALLQQDFSGKALDTWWDLEEDADVERIGVELQSSLEDKVLPFLESKSDFSQLHEFVSSMGGWQKEYPLMQIYFALLKNSLGEKTEAKDILKNLTLDKNKAWSSRAQKVISRI